MGGVAISAIGVDALRHAHRLHGHLAIASLPLILGAHQLDEAVVWFWQQGHIPRAIGELALWVYLMIAFVLLPLFVPLAMVTLEPTKRRRWSMAPFVAIGTVVAVVLFAAMVHGPVGVSARPYHLAYSLHVDGGLYIVGLYVVAVCGALLISGYRHVVIFGLVNLVAVAVIAKLTVDGFASVWCGWAAVTSGAIALHMRFAKPRRATPSVLT